MNVRQAMPCHGEIRWCALLLPECPVSVRFVWAVPPQLRLSMRNLPPTNHRMARRVSGSQSERPTERPPLSLTQPPIGVFDGMRAPCGMGRVSLKEQTSRLFIEE
jgi:hypothetical protein